VVCLGHYILWKHGIYDGEIFVSNLMHRNKKGVLSDFDLAPLADTSSARGRDRQGTRPLSHWIH
jgi:tRNA A-37 threonylcarbamoyl transferase component Bud32